MSKFKLKSIPVTHRDPSFLSKHESEILPFPNIEKNFALPDEMIQEVREGEM